MSQTLRFEATHLSDANIVEIRMRSEGGRSAPVDFHHVDVEPLCDSEDPSRAKWLQLKMEGSAGEFGAYYKSEFAIRLDALERVLQVYLGGQHGVDGRTEVGHMIWRLARHNTPADNYSDADPLPIGTQSVRPEDVIYWRLVLVDESGTLKFVDPERYISTADVLPGVLLIMETKDGPAPAVIGPDQAIVRRLLSTAPASG